MTRVGRRVCGLRASSRSCTPKLCRCRCRKKTGVVNPASTAPSSNPPPGPPGPSSSSTRAGKGFVVVFAAHDRVVQPAHHHGSDVLAAGRKVREKVHRLGLAVGTAAKLGTRCQLGQFTGKALMLSIALQFVQQRQRTFRLPVALVHEGENRAPALAANPEELARLRLDAFGRATHHHHRIHRGRNAVKVLGKVLVAGGVEQRYFRLL